MIDNYISWSTRFIPYYNEIAKTINSMTSSVVPYKNSCYQTVTTGPTSEGAGKYIIETRIGYYLSSDDMEQPYGYGLIIAKFCSSGYGQWGKLLSNNGYIHLTVGTFTLPGMYFFNRIAIENTLKRHGNKIIDAKPKEQVGK